MASVRCADDALGFTGIGSGAAEIPVQGNLLRNLIEGADLVMSHILHFYHLTALDYISTDYDGCPIKDQSPWTPKDNTSDMVSGDLANTLIGHYVTALNIRREAHRMAAYADGKHPCQPALIPGGVTKVVDANLATNMSNLLTPIRDFIDNTYIPDVKTVARAFSADLLVGSPDVGLGEGCKKYLAYGTFPNSAGSKLIVGGFLNTDGIPLGSWSVSPLNTDNIKEYIKYSYYNDAYDGLHPSVGVTQPEYGKTGAYSWLKAPRYVEGGTTHVCEVGPLARVLVNYLAGPSVWKTTVDAVLTDLGLAQANIPNLRSVLGRHAARAIECKVVADEMANWINSLTTTTSAGETYKHRDIPRISSTGMGLTEAPRGALGHWMRVDGRKISNYQCVVPSTWNLSPKDSSDQPGPIEQAIMGTVVTDDAVGRTRVGRIIRSFDPCIACAVHLVSPDKEKVTKFEVVPNR